MAQQLRKKVIVIPGISACFSAFALHQRQKQGAATVLPQYDLHVTQASLGAKAPSQRTLLYAQSGADRFVAAVFNPTVAETVGMDLVFEGGAEIRFSVEPPAEVHILGYFIMQMEDEEEDEPVSLEEGQELVEDKASGQSRLAAMLQGISSDEDSEEDSDFDGVLGDEEDEELAGSDEAEDDSSDSDEEPEPEPPKSKNKQEKSKPFEKAKPAEKKPEKPAHQKPQPSPAAPKPQVPSPKPGDKRAPGAPDQASKRQKAEQPSTPRPAAGGVLQERKLGGGLVIQDLRFGDGRVAQAGHRVQVRYAGHLKNGKMFDRGNLGFRLGLGEVVPGFDRGVAGMKVGGKRKVIIPAKLGYGAKGAPPDIPPNAELTFDIELLNAQ